MQEAKSPSAEASLSNSSEIEDSLEDSSSLAPKSAPKPKASLKRQTLSLLITVASAFLLVTLVQSFLFKPFVIPSDSMEPTIKPGDLIIVNRLSTDFGGPKDGDIIVFYAPVDAESQTCSIADQGENSSSMCSEAKGQRSSTYFIKRVEGVPGDRLSLRNGELYRNGKLVIENYTAPCDDSECNFPATITVPPNHYFMMGDNRGDSDDSRFWGAIPRSWIVGKALIRIWPLTRAHIF